MRPFNLVSEPFIPVVDLDGQSTECGLLDTLVNAHRLRSIVHSSPLVEVALTRLLLAILHRNFPTPDPKAWGKLWRNGQFDGGVLQTYFATWGERFDLFHATHPFYQVQTLAVDKDSLTPMTKLCSEFAAGNNGVIFDHSFDHRPVPVTAATAARRLICYQTYALGGGAGKPFNYSHSPLIGGYVSYPVGQTLFQTLMLSMVQVTEDSPIPQDGDRPTWELDAPSVPDPNGTMPRGYLDYLTFQSRQVRLVSDDASQMVTGAAILQGHKLPEGAALEPFCVYRIDKVRGYVACRMNPERAVWRDSEALLNFARADSPALAMAWLKRLRLADQLPDEPVSLQLVGLVNDKAKVELWRRDRFVLPAAYLVNPTLTDHVSAALMLAEAADKAIGTAVRELDLALWPKRRSNRDQGGARSSSSPGVRAAFWTELDPRFAIFMHECPVNPEAALLEWRHACIASARRVFDVGTSRVESDARSLRAVVISSQTLARHLEKLAPERGKVTA